MLFGRPMLSVITASSLGGDHLADVVLDLLEIDFGLFDPGAGGGAHVQSELAGVHRREEVAADEGIQQQRHGGEGEERDHRGPAVLQHPVERPLVGAGQPPKAGVEPVRDPSEDRSPRSRGPPPLDGPALRPASGTGTSWARASVTAGSSRASRRPRPWRAARTGTPPRRSRERSARRRCRWTGSTRSPASRPPPPRRGWPAGAACPCPGGGGCSRSRRWRRRPGCRRPGPVPPAS